MSMPKWNQISKDNQVSLSPRANIPATGTSQIPPIFSGDGSSAIRHSLRYRISQHKGSNEIRWNNAAVDAAFRIGAYAGHTGGTPTNVQTKSRFSCTQIDVKCGAVAGYQAQNRKTYKLEPLLPKYAKAAEQHNKIQSYLIQRESLLDKISASFEEAVTTGMCVSEPIIRNSSSQFNLGMTRWTNCDFIIDANYREPDCSDATYFATSEFLESDQVKFAYPWIKDSDLGRGGMYAIQPFYFQPQTINGQSYYLNHIIRLWQRVVYDKQYYVGLITGRKIPVERTDVFELMEHEEPWDTVSHRVNGWYNSIFCNNNLVKQELSAFGEATPFVPFYWKFNPQLKAADQRIVSLVRQLKDFQYLKDMTLNLALDALLSRPNGGIVYKEGSITDMKSLTTPDQVRNIGYTGDTPPQFIESNVVPDANILLQQYISQQIDACSPINLPVNPEGMRTDSGLKTMLQQGAQLVGLAPYMARLDNSVKNWGRLALYSVLYYMPVDMAEEIVGEPLDQFFWSVSEENCQFTPALGILTDTQAKETYVQYMEMFREAGIQPPLEVLKEISVAPEKEKIFGMLIDARDAAAKAAQAQVHMQEELVKAEVAKTNAEAIGQLSRAKEAEGRASSYVGLHAEHETKAAKSRADTLVGYTSAVKNIAELLATVNEETLKRAEEVVQEIADSELEPDNLASDMDELGMDLEKTTDLFERINNEDQDGTY